MSRPPGIKPWEQIDLVRELVANGRSQRSVARELGVGKDMVHRAVKRIYPALVRAREAQDLKAWEVLKIAINETLDLIESAKTGGNPMLIGGAVAQLSRLVDLMLKVEALAQVDADKQDITTTPQWTRFAALIAQTLMPYPEALGAVVAALEGAIKSPRG